MIIKPPITVSTTPNVRFKTLAEALFANFAETLAPINVKIIHKNNIFKLGMPPITKCETPPVKAVKVIIKTLVPTAVFNS